jgi:hypothetical protein
VKCKIVFLTARNKNPKITPTPIIAAPEEILKKYANIIPKIQNVTLQRNENNIILSKDFAV